MTIGALLDIMNGIQFIPVPPGHEHYPAEPNTFLRTEDWSRCYVRVEDWPQLKAELIRNSSPVQERLP